MRTFKLTLSYDGTAYAGWQIQPGQRTLQETLQRVLSRITGEPTHVAASGRTDAGVHALGQVVSFDTQSRLSAEVFQRALNAELPADMAVLAAAEVHVGFHARRDAVRKQYRYVIDDGSPADLFRRAYCWHYSRRLDAAAMHRAAQAWQGTHDFSSFESQGAKRQSSVRTVFLARVLRGTGRRANLVCFEVEGNGFLYHMVRTMVGTLVEVGRGSKPENWPAQVLAATDRSVAGVTAPPQGLFLVRVDYPQMPVPPGQNAELGL